MFPHSSYLQRSRTNHCFSREQLDNDMRFGGILGEVTAHAGLAEVLRAALAVAAVSGGVGASAESVSLHFAVYKKMGSWEDMKIATKWVYMSINGANCILAPIIS
jgi:hypothetical protein